MREEPTVTVEQMMAQLQMALEKGRAEGKAAERARCLKIAQEIRSHCATANCSNACLLIFAKIREGQ